MTEKQTLLPVPQLSQAALQANSTPIETPVAGNGLMELAKILGKTENLVQAYNDYKTTDAMKKQALELQGLPKDQIMEKLNEQDLDYYTRAARNKILGERVAREVRGEMAGVESDPNVTDVNAAINQKVAEWNLGDIQKDPHFASGFLPVMEQTRNEFMENHARALRTNDRDNIVADTAAIASDEISRRVKAGDLKSIPAYLASLSNSLAEKHIGLSKDDFDQIIRLSVARQFAMTDTANPAAVEAIFEMTNKQSLLSHPKYGDDAIRIYHKAQEELTNRQKFAFADRVAQYDQMAEQGTLSGEALDQFRREAEAIHGFVSPEHYQSILEKQNKKEKEAQQLAYARQVFQKDPMAPITGDHATDEQLRSKVFNEMLSRLGSMVSEKKMTEDQAFQSQVALAQQANQTVDQWKDILSAGVSSAGTSLTDPRVPIPDSVKNGVTLYRLLNDRAPQLIASHTPNEDARTFYASVAVAMKYQGLDMDGAIRQVVKDRLPDAEADARYQSIPQQAIHDDVENRLKIAYDGWLPFDSVKITNAADFAPAYERTVKRYIRQGLDQKSARDAAIDELHKNMVVIGDMAFPRGATPVVPEAVLKGSKVVGADYLKASKRNDLDAGDLQLAPHPTSPNLWFLIQKGNRVPVATYSTQQIQSLVSGNIIKKK